MAKGKGYRKGGAKRIKMRTYKPRRGFRPARSVPERASLTCSQWINVNTVANTMYNLRNIALNQFRRAVSTANAYQHFRIKKVQLEFKPSLDTFIAGGGSPGSGPIQVPYLIYMIDKSGSIPTSVGSEDLKQMGAKPIRFDDKTIKVSWRPSVLTQTFGNTLTSGVEGQSQYKISPWLSTNANALTPNSFVPSSIDHLGIYFKVDRAGLLPNDVPEITYDVQITVDFEFKKPLVQATGTVPATEVVMPAYNAGLPPQVVGDLSGN